MRYKRHFMGVLGLGTRPVVYLRICVRIVATKRWIVVSIIAVRHQKTGLDIQTVWMGTCDILAAH